MRVTLFLVTLLSVALSAATVEGTTLEDGWAAYDAGDYDRAYDVFSTLFRENPESEKANFALGMAALARGKLSHALFAFERVLIINPENQRARLELARTYTAIEQFSLARQEFQRVLETSPPEQVRRNIERYLAYIQESLSPWSYGVQAGVSVFYDDNVNFGPSSRFIETVIGVLQVASNSEPRESWGLSAGGAVTGGYDIGDRRGWLVTGGLTGYRNWLEDASDQEIGYFRADLGLRRLGARTLLDLPIKTDYLEIGSEDYLTIFGGEPSILFAPVPAWHLITKGFLEYRQYGGGEERDGPYYRLDQTVKRLFGGGEHNVAFTAGYYYEDADEPGNANHGVDLTLSTEIRFLNRTTLFGLCEFRTAEYRAELLPDLQDEDRRDTQWQFMIGLQQGLTDWSGLNFSYRRVNNNSNFGLYEYERNVVALSTYFLF